MLNQLPIQGDSIGVCCMILWMPKLLVSPRALNIKRQVPIFSTCKGGVTMNTIRIWGIARVDLWNKNKAVRRVQAWHQVTLLRMELLRPVWVSMRLHPLLFFAAGNCLWLKCEIYSNFIFTVRWRFAVQRGRYDLNNSDYWTPAKWRSYQENHTFCSSWSVCTQNAPSRYLKRYDLCERNIK